METLPIEPVIREYHAIFTQTGTADPVVTVLHNTLTGTPAWTRTGVGVYVCTLETAFTSGKTVIEPYGGNAAAVRLLLNPAGQATPYSTVNIDWTSADAITVRVYTAVNSNTAREFSDTPGDMFIKIAVYK